jgi:MFS transporter, DHA2 family, methylenomycin A resistance protein
VTGHPSGRARRGRGLAGLCLGTALVVLDANVLNVAVPTIRAELGGGVTVLLWVIAAYSLPFAVLLLSAGALGDRVGARRMVLAGLTVFAAASLACTAAPSAGFLIAGRAVQGAGAALLAPGCLALIAGMYPRAGERARAVGVWAGVSGIGFAAGPALGGVLVAAAGWRSIFLLNLPVIAAAMWLIARHVPAPAAKPERFDLPGQVLAAGGLAAVVAGLVQSAGGGFTPAVITALAGGAVMLAGFWAVERSRERHGRSVMLALSLVAPAPMRAGLLAAAVFNFGLYGMLIVFSVVLQQQHHYSALQAGLAFLPLTVVAAMTSGLLAGRLTARHGARPVLTAGLTLAAAGCAVLAWFGQHSGYGLAAAGFTVFGAACGLSLPALTALVLASAPAGQAGRASGVLNAARQLGGVLGVALLGLITVSHPSRLPLALGLAGAAFAAAGVAAARWSKPAACARDEEPSNAPAPAPPPNHDDPPAGDAGQAGPRSALPAAS